VQKADEQARAPKLDRAIQDRIGRELRAMYAGLVTQPVPDRLLALIYNLHQSPSDCARRVVASWPQANERRAGIR
jgi:hypothetical protein